MPISLFTPDEIQAQGLTWLYLLFNWCHNFYSLDFRYFVATIYHQILVFRQFTLYIKPIRITSKL